MTTAEKAPLTARQKQAYDFITSHMELYSPTVREIARAMSIKSPNGVVVHLDALEKKGWITRRPNASRGIEVTP
jgi:repressor LexA